MIDAPIFGPPFSHPRQPYRAEYLGTYTPLTCPEEYIAAIGRMLEVYQSQVRNHDITHPVPLIINTQGWIKGLGAELLYTVETLSGPSHIIDISKPAGSQPPGWTASPEWHTTNLPIPDQPVAKGKNKVARLNLEPASVTSVSNKFTSADLRTISLLAYFHHNFKDSTWDFSDPLLTIPPYEVCLSIFGPLFSVYLIGEGSDGILPEDLSLALNGSIVALIDIPDQIDDARGENGEESVYVQGRSPPEKSDCLGLALIRAVEQRPKGVLKLQMVTPLSPDVLKRAKGMVRNGAIELPTWGLMDHRKTGRLPRMKGREEIPFLDTSEVEAVGLDKRKIRRNLQRRNV
ncbi:hypothetical protein TREMEDRAFT_72158 [Tremella mesenterica DSM 1558]|uniref:uncharacterized protein n=1 Tax=Tremella mesenterica (strain ATCC 24925 / CBS 8224 / DSM 1558 / NBRC 9311 / NRRL Y-6157 / RJB 2259-6 / UBC 559-6) TaxID=578456 RepID=UPI0003F49F32|nr:uncharacterized protein TREMEDRAFT_72158 [Tremella mesenterica DSM 1558]EIW67687.1 hypothetical protein TREMEDRAFT_72158 [Tremella mesenterica DSM 1558]